MGTSFDRAVWRKSSRSNGSGACVEVGFAASATGVRDTKLDDSPILAFPPKRFGAFLNAVKAGQLDR